MIHLFRACRKARPDIMNISKTKREVTIKPIEYFDKRVKELLHDVSTYVLAEHRKAVPAIVALTAELTDTDFHYAYEAYIKGLANHVADTVKAIDSGEVSSTRASETLRDLSNEWLPHTNDDLNEIVMGAIRLRVTNETINNELKERGYYD